ncbi:hypothetical protein H4R23_003524 [Coemansia sp. Cherry 401B]|nr:hypothetical protein H4R23_003524 [Coemansia sp. Cherry 401B]
MFLIHLVQGAKALAKAAGAKASAAANKPRAVVRKAVHGLRAKGSQKSAGRRLSTDSTATTVVDCLAADAPEIDDAEPDFTASMATLTGPDATIPDDLIEEIDTPEEGANSAISAHKTDPQPAAPVANPVAADDASEDTPIHVLSDAGEGVHNTSRWSAGPRAAPKSLRALMTARKAALKCEELRVRLRTYRTLRQLDEEQNACTVDGLLKRVNAALALEPTPINPVCLSQLSPRAFELVTKADSLLDRAAQARHGTVY